jgi:hypothetical protein
LPKRRNAVLRLYDAPLYRDWAFWHTVGWGLIAGISIPTTPPAEPSPLPLWLDTLLAIITMVLTFGIVPAWLRLLFRRWQWHRRQRPSVVASVPPPEADLSSSDSPLTTPDRRSGPNAEEGTARIGVQRTVWNAELLTQARSTLPHPVARAVRTLQQAHTPRDQYEALLDAAETLTVTICVTAAALLLEQSETPSDGQQHPQAPGRRNLSRLRKAYLRGAMFGTWTTWLDGLRSLATTHPHLTAGLQAALQGPPDAPGIVEHLNSLREERNRAAHGDKPKSGPEFALRVSESAPHLERALDQAQFLRDVPWLYTVSCVYQPRSRSFDIVADHAMGDHPDFERRTFVWDRPVGNEIFYLLGPEGPVPLSPFVANLLCPQCRQVEVSYAYKFAQSSHVAVFKSFGRGHEITSAELGDELRSLPAQ